MVGTNADKASTAVDAVSTNADAISTAADLVGTNADVVAASGSAADALGYKNTASSAADTALATLDSFDDKYLGAKSSNPTLDNGGDTLLVGALYYNTLDEVMNVYSGSTWVAAYASLSGALLQTSNLGDIITRPTNEVPVGYLECDGSEVSRVLFLGLFNAIGTLYGVGDGSLTFNIPDLRGEFIRGFDNGRGIDSGRLIGSFQVDEFKSHSHATSAWYWNTSIGGNAIYGSNGSGSSSGGGTGGTGGTETRPRNIAMLYCIKY